MKISFNPSGLSRMPSLRAASAFLWAVTLSFLAISPSVSANAERPRGVSPGSARNWDRAAPLQRRLVWNDGEREHSVWLNPRMIAEVDELHPVADTELRSQFPEATLEVRRRLERTRLWRVGSTTSLRNKSARPGKPGKKLRVSEVFHTRASSRSPLMILPGGFLLTLNPDWTPEQCQQWITQQGLQLKRQLPQLKNTFVIATEPGLPALETANSLLNQEGVVSSVPDWKLEVSRK